MKDFNTWLEGKISNCEIDTIFKGWLLEDNACQDCNGIYFKYNPDATELQLKETFNDDLPDYLLCPKCSSKWTDYQIELWRKDLDCDECFNGRRYEYE